MSELPIARALLLLPFILATACSSGDNATSQSGSGGGSGTGTSAGSGGAGGGGAGGAGGAGGGDGGTGGGSADPCEKPWPSATSTGIPDGTPQLTALNDDFHTEQDGQVFDAVELNGRLYIDHKNITIRRSRLVGDQYYAVYAADTADGLTIEDCDIEGGLLLPNNTTVRRSHAHAGAGGSRADGFIFAASNVLLEDNLIDGLAGGDGAHVDGIQDMGGTGIVIRHNWIDPSSPPINNGGVNAALFVSPEFGNPSSDVTVECNMLLGGGSWYPLRIYNTTGAVVVVGNRFDRNFMGVPVHLVETTITTWGDNAYADNGEEIPPP